MTDSTASQTDIVAQKGLEVHTRVLWRVVLSSAIGSTVEWYDFFIFATASVLVFNKVFFPDFDPFVGSLVAMTTYAVGFFARPFGGFVFGHLGDVKGRKIALVVTLLISGASTFAVGLLPGYGTVGVWAPILLLLVRLLQGFSIGGEQGNAILIACEFAPPLRRGFFGSIVQMGCPIGYIVPLGLFALLTTFMSEADFMSWGWRIPFLCAGLLVALGLYIRLNLSESPAFKEMEAKREASRSPISDLLRFNRRELLLGSGAKLAEGVIFQVYAVLIVAYAVSRGIDKTVMTTGLLVAFVLDGLLLPIYGMLIDRVGRRPIYIFGAGASILIAPLAFYAVYVGNIEAIWFGLCAAVSIAHAAMYATQAAFFTEMFPVERRASGISFVQQIGSVLGSALALLSGWLLKANTGMPWLMVAYIIANALVSLICTLFLSETAPRIVRAIHVRRH